MKSFLILIASFGLAFNTFAAEKSLSPEDMPEGFKSGDSSAGSDLVGSCVACHGADGNSVNTDWPKLAGQNEKYLYEQLKYFKSGERNNALMMTVTTYLQTLNDKDLLDIAAFYSSNVSTGGQAKNDKELLELGTKLYRFGDIKKQIPACTSCHSVYGDGNSVNTDWPKLAGQNEKYLYEQLKYFKSGERNNALMMTVTTYLQTLNDKDLLDIAAFYSSNVSTGGQAKNDEKLLELGTKLYRFGDIKKQIPACTSCHSVYGDGNNLANYPSVAGQQVGYLVSSLKAYRSKERNAGEQSLVMQSIAENLTDNEIDALANYMHGLYK